MKEYNWTKLSIIAHSMGANVAFIYASIFPERVDMVINIDGLKPTNRDFHSIVTELEDSLENFMVADQRNQDNSESPAYTIDEMVERTYVGSFKSVTRECAPFLLKRSIKPSKKYPGKFCFAKDGRLKHSIGFNLSLSTYVDFAREVKMPYLVVKASQVPVIEDRANYDAVLNGLKESDKFEYLLGDSFSHHLHLTEPQKIAGGIGKFILKHKTAKSHL
jgi:pimeloyl-ACP methyl ester carboxylesterase